MTASGFSLVDGGPLCRLFRRFGWVHADGHCDYLRACIVIASVTWGPLLILAWAERLLTGHTPLVDWGVHARLLIAVPLLLRAEASLHMRTLHTTERLSAERWALGEPGQLDRIFAAAARLRDAAAPEILLLGAALIGSQIVVWKYSGLPFVARRYAVDPPIGASYWYAFVALPVFQFLVYRALWRWAIWAKLLWQLSRFRLQPIATHPDQAGGLGFLVIPSIGFAYVVAALSAVQAGVWADQVLNAGADVRSFKTQALIIALAGVAVALGPLIVFARHLWRCRFAGERQYGSLATDYTRLFHARWIEQSERRDLLGNADIQSLADLANSYGIAARVRLLPFGLLPVAVVLGAAVAPLIPVALLGVPVTELLSKVAGTLLGRPR